MRTITDYINNDFNAIDCTEKIGSVHDFFSELHFTHFPVQENGVYAGCISAEDAETFDKNKTISDYKYTLEGFLARPEMNWLDVLEVFARNNTNLVPILDENNKYIGYYEVTDIIKFFHETPFLKDLGGIIIVEKNFKEHSMSQITQIVESNNGKLLGLFVSNVEDDKIQVTIKISLGEMNTIIQTFRRYNYEIISEHQEDNYLKNLKERSDYLRKYLNF